MRCETPRRRAMEMATASVGLRMAPMATAQAKDRPGTRRVRANPMAPADSATRRTARMATEAISRRKLMVEMLTAVENSSGGRMPSRTTPGSNSTAGTKGRKPTPIPAASRMRAGATPMRWLNCDAAAIPSTPSTAIMRRSMEASLRFRECASPGANDPWTDTAPIAEIGRIPPRDRFSSASKSVQETGGAGAAVALTRCEGGFGEGRTWERRSFAGASAVFRVVPRFPGISQDRLTCSHVHRPLYVHMGAHRSIVRTRIDWRDYNENLSSLCWVAPLPCADRLRACLTLPLGRG